jgi:hypothetical protein
VGGGVAGSSHVEETADKQSSFGGSLILAYCKHNKVVCVGWGGGDDGACVCRGGGGGA